MSNGSLTTISTNVSRYVGNTLEMIIGLQTDPQFGPVIALGSGGTLVELLDDVVLRLAPFTSRQATAMIQETRSWPLLQGFRQHPPADITALATLLVNIARLAIDQAGQVVSLDLNPVIVLPQGAQVVDWRVIRRD